MRSRSLSYREASVLASAGLVFTTHTPVEAGHDYFSTEMVRRYFGSYAESLGLSHEEFVNLGRVRPGEGEFCMTVLALRFASRANGVSRLHGRVSRAMWNKIWPEIPEDEVPIRHVTNGVHFPSWTSLEMKRLYDRYLGPDWREEPANGEVWQAVQAIPAEELWRTHELRRERLVNWARRHVREQRIRRGASRREIDAADEVLNPDALTICFARRFATYKRATLILRDRDRLKRLLSDGSRPVQLILAGKAHPRDDAGKELIRQVTHLSRDPEWGRRVVFIEDYDMAVARYLVQGVDVWLNTPVRPNEASGTSGMKAAANGALNLSILDGWWDEVYSDAANRQSIGWAIGRGESYQDPEYRDQVEAAALYDILERDVVPTFYDRGADRLPRMWVERMKASIATICHVVNTHRMVSQYAQEIYMPAADAFARLGGGEAGRTRAFAAWVDRVRAEWPNVRVDAIARMKTWTVPVLGKVRASARIRLGGLSIDDVAVELYLGRLNSVGEIARGIAIPMVPLAETAPGVHEFAVEASCPDSGQYGYTVRVRPTHPDLVSPMSLGLVRWADAQVATAAAGMV
jgi:starch phosphorylase